MGVKTIKLQKMEQVICMFIYEYDLKRGQMLGQSSLKLIYLVIQIFLDLLPY